MESPAGNLIFLGLLIAIFYFMLIRPQKRRVQQHRNLIESLGVGDEIVTIGGVFGRIRSMGEDDLELDVSPTTTVRLLKSAVARKVTEELEDTGDSSGGEPA